MSDIHPLHFPILVSRGNCTDWTNTTWSVSDHLFLTISELSRPGFPLVSLVDAEGNIWQGLDDIAPERAIAILYHSHKSPAVDAMMARIAKETSPED